MIEKKSTRLHPIQVLKSVNFTYWGCNSGQNHYLDEEFQWQQDCPAYGRLFIISKERRQESFNILVDSVHIFTLLNSPNEQVWTRIKKME